MSKIVTIDASTVEEGINQVDQLYRNEEIILDTNDYLSTEYVPLDMVNVNSSKDKVAPSEVYEFVKLFWPNWIAKLIMRFYVKSQNTNAS